MVDGSPHTVDLIRSGKVQLILNTPLGMHAHSDGAEDPRGCDRDECPFTHHIICCSRGCFRNSRRAPE